MREYLPLRSRDNRRCQLGARVIRPDGVIHCLSRIGVVYPAAAVIVEHNNDLLQRLRLGLGLLAAAVAGDLKDDGGLTGHDLPAIIAVFQADGVGFLILAGSQRMHVVRAILLIVLVYIGAAGDGDVHIVVAVALVVTGPLYVGILGHGIAPGKQAVSGVLGGVRSIFVDTLHLHSALAQQAGVALLVAVQLLTIRRLRSLNHTQLKHMLGVLMILREVAMILADRNVYGRNVIAAGNLEIECDSLDIIKGYMRIDGRINSVFEVDIVVMNQIIVFPVITFPLPAIIVVIFICAFARGSVNADFDAVEVDVRNVNGSLVLGVVQLNNPLQKLVVLIVHNMNFRSAILRRGNLLSKNGEVLFYGRIVEERITTAVPAFLLPVDEPVSIMVAVNRVGRHVVAEGFLVIYEADSIR